MGMVSAAFDPSRYDLYVKPYALRVNRSQVHYTQALEILPFPADLPEDLKLMVAFLWVDGFFEHYKVRVDHWLDMPNFQNPNLPPNDHLSINQLANTKNGWQEIRQA